MGDNIKMNPQEVGGNGADWSGSGWTRDQRFECGDELSGSI